MARIAGWDSGAETEDQQKEASMAASIKDVEGSFTMMPSNCSSEDDGHFGRTGILNNNVSTSFSYICAPFR